MNSSASILVLTGAGISAESGIKTFRGGDGLWENHRLEDVATPEAFFANPTLVQRFYDERRRQLQDPAIKPNAAHQALANLEKQWNGPFLLVTQNVDNLHERAGSKKLIHMHGQLLSALCAICGQSAPWVGDLSAEEACPRCLKPGALRPDIVWFGEMPYQMDLIQRAVEQASIFLAIGTSGQVYPAAGFARWAYKAKKYEVNMDSTSISPDFDFHLRGTATVEVPRLVQRILQDSNASLHE